MPFCHRNTALLFAKPGKQSKKYWWLWLSTTVAFSLHQMGSWKSGTLTPLHQHVWPQTVHGTNGDVQRARRMTSEVSLTGSRYHLAVRSWGEASNMNLQTSNSANKGFPEPSNVSSWCEGTGPNVRQSKQSAGLIQGETELIHDTFVDSRIYKNVPWCKLITMPSEPSHMSSCSCKRKFRLGVGSEILSVGCGQELNWAFQLSSHLPSRIWIVSVSGSDWC